MEREKLRLDKREQSIYAHKAWGCIVMLNMYCNMYRSSQKVGSKIHFFFGGGGTNVWKILDRGYSL